MKQNEMVTNWNSWNAMSTETQIKIMNKFLAKIIRMTDEKAHEKYYKENHLDIVFEAWLKLNEKDFYQKKYSDNAVTGIFRAVGNACYRCYTDDISNATALTITGTDGNENCIIDTEWERNPDYVFDTEETAIMNAIIATLPDAINQAICTDYRKGYTYEQIGKRLFHYWKLTDKVISHTAVRKRLTSLEKYFK